MECVKVRASFAFCRESSRDRRAPVESSVGDEEFDDGGDCDSGTVSAD